jgi:hypothetical protein
VPSLARAVPPGLLHTAATVAMKSLLACSIFFAFRILRHYYFRYFHDETSFIAPRKYVQSDYHVWYLTLATPAPEKIYQMISGFNGVPLSRKRLVCSDINPVNGCNNFITALLFMLKSQVATWPRPNIYHPGFSFIQLNKSTSSAVIVMKSTLICIASELTAARRSRIVSFAEERVPYDP